MVPGVSDQSPVIVTSDMGENEKKNPFNFLTLRLTIQTLRILSKKNWQKEVIEGGIVFINMKRLKQES